DLGTPALLSEPEALDLLARSYGAPSGDALVPEARAAAQRIVTLLARSALAIRLIRRYAAEGPHSLPAVVAVLEADALTVAEGDEARAVERAFRQSAGQLPIHALRLFVALATCATTELSRGAVLALAAALNDLDPTPNLDLLIRRALVDPFTLPALPARADHERIRLHPLLRAIAQRAFAAWPAASRDAANRALAAYYATYMNTAPAVALAPDEANILAALEWVHDHNED